MKWQRTLRSWFPPGVARWSAILTIALLVFAWIVPSWRLAPIVEPEAVIPLHYNIYFGVDFVGKWWWVYFLPAFGTVVFIINAILAARERKGSKVFSDMLSITYSVVALFVTVAMFFVLLINV